MAATDPAPTWPIEPTTFFLFTYYPTNGVNEDGTYNSNLMTNYNECVAACKAYILAQNNEGVCVIQQVACTVIYPSIPWEAF
jgi:hypothetical protein